MTPYEKLVFIAEQYVGTEELDGNRGQLIDHWNRLAGVPLGSPWCASFVQFCVNGVCEQLSIKTNLFKSAHVLSIFNNSKKCWVQHPKKGALIVWQLGDTNSGHIEIIKEIIDPDTLLCIGGNTTGEKSVNREGRFVAENQRKYRAAGKLKFKGFLDPWRGIDLSV